MITHKLGSYAAARHQIILSVEHRSHKGLTNRAENSHLLLRKREWAMQGFQSPRGLQRFVNVFTAVRNIFVPPGFRRSAVATHVHRLNAMVAWKSAACIARWASHVAALASLRPSSVDVTSPPSDR
jgi:putative transposase